MLAELLRVPEIVLLLAAGAALGPSALDVLDVPLDSLGAQLVFTLGVSSILFYGGLNLSLLVLREVWVSLGLLSILGVCSPRWSPGPRPPRSSAFRSSRAC